MSDFSSIINLLSLEEWTLDNLSPGVPYEYISVGSMKMSRDDFMEVIFLLQNGPDCDDDIYSAEIEGYRYWAYVSGKLDDVIILYRQKIFDEFDSLQDPTEQHYSDQMLYDISSRIMALFPDEDIYEAACGCGSFVSASSISPQRYRGSDPSHKAIDKFKDSHPQYAESVGCLSFEEDSPRWMASKEVVISTFGAPNYFMRQYLKILSGSRRRVFLMFYKDDFCPAEFQSMHHTSYTMDSLKALFPSYNLEVYKDQYYIVSGPVGEN